MKDFKIRPYRIAAELDSMFTDKHLSGIGTLDFTGTSDLNLTDEYCGLCLQFLAYHGEEDKNNVQPQENPAHVQDFKDVIEDY